MKNWLKSIETENGLDCARGEPLRYLIFFELMGHCVIDYGIRFAHA